MYLGLLDWVLGWVLGMGQTRKREGGPKGGNPDPREEVGLLGSFCNYWEVGGHLCYYPYNCYKRAALPPPSSHPTPVHTTSISISFFFRHNPTQEPIFTFLHPFQSFHFSPQNRAPLTLLSPSTSTFTHFRSKFQIPRI